MKDDALDYMRFDMCNENDELVLAKLRAFSAASDLLITLHSQIFIKQMKEKAS